MHPFITNSDWRTNHKALRTLPRNQLVLLACDVARLVLPVFEQQFPTDNRPRIAIETTEFFVYGKASQKQLKKAHSAVVESYQSRLCCGKTTTTSAYCAAQAIAKISNIVNVPIYGILTTVSNGIIYALKSDHNVQKIIKSLYQQTTPTPIPITPTLQSIAQHIAITRNFQEYYVLLDNLEEFHNIQLERTAPKGLSHYVLFTLTNTH